MLNEMRVGDPIPLPHSDGHFSIESAIMWRIELAAGPALFCPVLLSELSFSSIRAF